MHVFHHKLRTLLLRYDLMPRSTTGKVTAYILGVDLALFLVKELLGLFGRGQSLSGWVSFLTTVGGTLAIYLGLRWVRRRLLWRLRNRLIVTYVFIGVIPVFLLLVMACIAGFLFAGQFASFVANTDIQEELKAVEAWNSDAFARLNVALQRGQPLTAETLRAASASTHDLPKSRITAWYGEKGVALDALDPTPPSPKPGDFSAISIDRDGTWLRAARSAQVGKQKLTVISSVPLDREVLDKTAGSLGVITLYSSDPEGKPVSSNADEKAKEHARERMARKKDENDVMVDSRGVTMVDKEGESKAPRRVSAGTLPPPANRLDREFPFGSPVTMLDWDTGNNSQGLMFTQTRPSLLYHRLFLQVGELSGYILIALEGVAISFGIIEFIALIIGLRLTRTITKSVSSLYRGTQHINRGDFSHRIKVETTDQLAALETSFNSMTESLEKLIQEQKEKQRLENELAIAQEVQATLFPKQISGLASLEVHGICQPARTVSGDYYDFLPLGPEKLGLAVGDISGKGISAALLMATIHSAVRAYEFGRVPMMRAQLVPAGSLDAPAPTHVFDVTSGPFRDGEFSSATVLALLNRQLVHSTPAEKYATMFLGVFDGASRVFTYSNAGHLPPAIIAHDGSIRRLDTGGMVIGLFDDQSYEERTVQLHAGDLFVAFSDGLTEPENEFGEFGEDRLLDLIRENRDLPLARISEIVITTIHDWIGAAEQPDDVTLVLARAR